MIQNLKFRDIWYFVGKKGIKGFTPFEQVVKWVFFINLWMFIKKNVKMLKRLIFIMTYTSDDLILCRVSG